MKLRLLVVALWCATACGPNDPRPRTFRVQVKNSTHFDFVATLECEFRDPSVVGPETSTVTWSPVLGQVVPPGSVIQQTYDDGLHPESLVSVAFSATTPAARHAKFADETRTFPLEDVDGFGWEVIGADQLEVRGGPIHEGE